jgi:hypothetical protein
VQSGREARARRGPVHTQVGGTGDQPNSPAAQLPPIATQWVRYLVGFTVSVAVGLAPYLGKVNVPLFTPLLSFIPLFVQGIAIPLSTAAMGIVAVFVQWYGSARVSKAWTARMFTRTLVASVVLLLALAVVEMLAVERLYIPATGQTVSTIVGFSYPNKPPCLGLSRARCIETRLGLDPSTIETYFGDQQVKVAQVVLILTYTLFMSSFAVMVGVLVLARRNT